jgi:hypothetical protein
MRRKDRIDSPNSNFVHPEKSDGFLEMDRTDRRRLSLLVLEDDEYGKQMTSLIDEAGLYWA